MSQLIAEVSLKLLSTAVAQLGAKAGATYLHTERGWITYLQALHDPTGHLVVDFAEGKLIDSNSALGSVLNKLAEPYSAIQQDLKNKIGSPVTVEATPGSVLVPIIRSRTLWAAMRLDVAEIVEDINSNLVPLCELAILLLDHAYHYTELKHRSLATEISMDGVGVLIDGYDSGNSCARPSLVCLMNGCGLGISETGHASLFSGRIAWAVTDGI